MKKSIFKKLIQMFAGRVSHGGKGFSKVIDNPAGSKFRNRCDHISKRGADGTIR